MRKSSIVAIGALVAAVASSPAADTWGEEDFGPIDEFHDPAGNNSNGNSTPAPNTTNSTTTTITTTRTATTTTVTTTLPKYDFINMAFFKVGDTGPRNHTTASPGLRLGSGNDTNATTTTTTTTVTTLHTKDASCALNAAGQKAYYAKLSRTGCTCTAMPEPPRGWESWGGIHYGGQKPHYQLTMAAATAEGNQVASFRAFCNPTCTTCNIVRVADSTLNMTSTCESQEPLDTEILDYNACDQAGAGAGESFFIRQPADVNHMGEEFCVLQERAAVAEGSFTVVEFPHATACDANGTSNLYRSGAMIGQTYSAVPENAGVCTEAYDGSYYDLYTEINTATNETDYAGTMNCLNPNAKKASQNCNRDSCDFMEATAMGACHTVDNSKDKGRASYSLKIIGSGDVSQCFIPQSRTTTTPPNSKPSSKSNTGVVIGAAVAGVAVVAIVIIFIIRKRRASRAAAYSVLQGSAYTEN